MTHLNKMRRGEARMRVEQRGRLLARALAAINPSDEPNAAAAAQGHSRKI